ncbi:unnamed protein product [Cylicocyclus nassatus]|uniref:E2 ubiquitin-conjugating enzyme n=1 Tax=Cylicocyclus nassatus TaxID=53992 RepID=A0AA36GNH0_CYLNA|nr:unnamed protein product [Cylicocyclus nassatus]
MLTTCLKCRMPRTNEARPSLYSTLRTTNDAIQAAASMLRFVDDTATRTVQPGQGIRGEHGVIASGRVIPMLSVELDGPHTPSSSRADSTTTSPLPSASPPRTSPRPPTPVRRILRRKIGVLQSQRAAKRTDAGRDDRTEVITRLLNEETAIQSDAPPGCYASPKADDLFLWTVVIEGPPGSVYEGGTFFCNIHVSLSYPITPPKVEFLTRIYHCNVNAQGEVCIDVLNDNWKPTMSIRTVLIALRSLMFSCNPDEALVPSIAKLYRENRSEFDKMARIWTQRYAV